MANLNESIEQLTASLQELTAQSYTHAPHAEAVGGPVAAEELPVSKEVESFLDQTRAYTEQTRNVSVGTY